MLVDTHARLPDLRQSSGFVWDAAPLPADNTSTSNVIVADGLCLTAASPNKTAARQFMAFAASAFGQAQLARAGAIVPALTAVAASPAFLEAAAPPTHNQVFLDARAHALALPKLENWPDIQAIVDQELGQAFYGHKSPAQALDAATLRSEEYFKIHTAH
jgi:multiple sugar transport system substrate-binding protein